MRKIIQPVQIGLDLTATQIEVADLYLGEHHIDYSLSLYAKDNQQVLTRRMMLKGAPYQQWCESGASVSNVEFILNLEIATRGFVVVEPPAAAPVDLPPGGG